MLGKSLGQNQRNLFLPLLSDFVYIGKTDKKAHLVKPNEPFLRK